MLTVVILICSISTPPGDCDAAHALEMLNIGVVRSLAACGVQAQAVLARSAIKPVPEREYVKVRCAREG